MYRSVALRRSSMTLLQRKSRQQPALACRVVFIRRSAVSIGSFILFLAFVFALVTKEKTRSTKALLTGVVRQASAYSANALYPCSFAEFCYRRIPLQNVMVSLGMSPSNTPSSSAQMWQHILRYWLSMSSTSCPINSCRGSSLKGSLNI